MSKYSKEDILRMVDEEDVGFIRLQFTDVFGTVKNIAVTAGQLEQALNNECSFDGSGIDGFVRIEEMTCTCVQIWIRLRSFHGDLRQARLPV